MMAKGCRVSFGHDVNVLILTVVRDTHIVNILKSMNDTFCF